MEGRQNVPYVTREEATAVFKFADFTRDKRDWKQAQARMEEVSGRKRNPKTVKALLGTTLEFLRLESQGKKFEVPDDSSAELIAENLSYNISARGVQRYAEWFLSYRGSPSPLQTSVNKQQANAELEVVIQEYQQRWERQMQAAEIAGGRKSTFLIPPRIPMARASTKKVVGEACLSDPQFTSLESEFQQAVENLDIDRAKSLRDDLCQCLTRVLDLPLDSQRINGSAAEDSSRIRRFASSSSG